MRTGHGLWRKDSPSSDKYEGEFSRNLKEGYGIYEWSQGHVYKGEYRGNVRHGYGEMRWADGSSYCGWWQDDRQSGQGVMEDGKGAKVTGVFREGVMVEVLREEKLPRLNLSAERSSAHSRRNSLPKDRHCDTPIAGLETEHSSESKAIEFLVTRQVNAANPLIQARTIRQKKYKVGNSFLQNSRLKRALATANSKSSGSRFSIFRSLDLRKRAAAAPSPNATLRNKMPHSSLQIQKLHESRGGHMSGGDLGVRMSEGQPRSTQRISAASRPAASRIMYLP